MMRVFATALVATVLLIGAAAAQQRGRVAPGYYLCTVEAKASIGSTHLENAPPPDARVEETPRYRFRLLVSAEGDRLRVTEAPYDGPERSLWQWEDDNSTLHAAYIGNGAAFVAEGAPGILNFGRDRWGDALQFYHAGFEYGGGEDEQMSIRWGRCAPEPAR